MRPDFEQVSHAIQAGDGFVAYVANKSWGSRGSTSKCIVLERRYGVEEEGKRFIVNFSIQGALETKSALECLVKQNKESLE